METVGPVPNRYQAASDLDAVAQAQRAVRDRPWPLWLYPANVMLLSLMALTPLLGAAPLGAWVVIWLAVFVVNFGAGRVMGTPFAVPTSRGFRIGVAMTAAFLAASMAMDGFGHERLIPLCAVGVAVSYGIASVLHWRSTHR